MLYIVSLIGGVGVAASVKAALALATKQVPYRVTDTVGVQVFTLPPHYSRHYPPIHLDGFGTAIPEPDWALHRHLTKVHHIRAQRKQPYPFGSPHRRKPWGSLKRLDKPNNPS